MSAAEIKASIDRMTEDERFFAAAYLQHLARMNEPGFQMLLTERMRQMDAGRRVSFEQAERMHRSLESEGL
jgi:hypothetical protein